VRKAKTAATGDVQKAKVMARRLIEHHFKTKPHRITYQVGGMTNIVFVVHHDEGEFVVRIGQNPGKINAYIKEQWAVVRAQKAGVPTSEILEVGNEVIPTPYMISRRVSGRAATYHPERMNILRQLGRYTALIHTIRTDGFGNVFDWSNNQLSRNETWADFLFQEISLEARLGILGKYKMLSPSKLKELGDVLERGGGKKAVPGLNHGDIRLKNVLVDQAGKITALIDWEDCMSSLTPEWDLSLALHDLSIDEKLEFIDGYGLPEEKFMDSAPLVKALNIINYAPHIGHLGAANNSAELAKYRLRLSGAMDLYSL
jgi:aminoglycoside phosphotransferase (APT) family kinase protein